jgi:formate/nitrite transporter FocA (FNT family)
MNKSENKIDKFLIRQLTEKDNDIAKSKTFFSDFYLVIAAGMFISLAFVFYISANH